MKETLIKYWQSHSELILSLGYNVFLSIVVFLSCWVISGIIKKAILRANDKIEQLDATLVPILCTTSKYIVYVIGTVIILDIFGVNTASIIALLGAVGLGVAFALKDTLSNIAAGIMLLILRPFRVNETIEFGAILGTVKEINLFTTILETPDGLFVSSPNGTVWASSIKNFNRNGKRRFDIVVGISYSDSINTGVEVLNKIIESETRLLSDPQAQVMVISMGDSSVNLQLRGWTLVSDYWQTQWDLTKKVKEEIEAAGMSIPFPQREINVISKTT